MQIIFNPRCTKCRILKNALAEEEMAWEAIPYLEEGLEKEQVARIFEAYDGHWYDLIRKKESAFRENGIRLKDLKKTAAIDLVVAHPVILQRPIVLKDGAAYIVRDADSLASLMQA